MYWKSASVATERARIGPNVVRLRVFLPVSVLEGFFDHPWRWGWGGNAQEIEVPGPLLLPDALQDLSKHSSYPGSLQV